MAMVATSTTSEEEEQELEETHRYKLEVLVHCNVLEHIIEVQQSIEEKTNTELSIPSSPPSGLAFPPIIIHSFRTRRPLYRAKERIYNKVERIRNYRSVRPTHFIAIALHSDTIQAKVEEFNREVLRTCGDSRGVDEDILQAPIRMHLTIAVLRLLFPEDVSEAVKAIGKVIDECKNIYAVRSRCLPIKDLWDFDASPLRISLDGISCMNTTDLSSANIVYAQVSSPPRLQEFADTLLRKMIAEIPLLVKNENRPHITLHATVMNSRWRNSTGGSSAADRSFDATRIFDLYGDFHFGKCEPSEVLLLDMREGDERGFYKCVETFSLNTTN